MRILACLIVSIFLLASTPSANAQWSANTSVNTPICVFGSTQYNQASTSDGNGGAIVAWQDARTGGVYDIYAQRVNSSGNVQWTANGIVICSATDIQANPSIIGDGAGGAIITWWDRRGGSVHDIYAQRVDANGAVQWTANGVAICTSTGDKGFPELVSDGSGGAIITWSDSRNPSQAYDIYAQRINSSGTVQWTADGVLVCTASINQFSPAIVSDGSGGAIMAWEDNRSGNYDIYAERINSSGVSQWTANGVAICAASNDQISAALVSDLNHGAIIVWNDSRNGATATDIYAQRILSAGSVSWTANGVALCVASNNQSLPQIITDGSGGAIVTWNDIRSGSDYDVYAQAIDGTGATQWTANGTIVCAQTGDQKNPRLVADGNGGAVFAWQDSRNGSLDLYALLINGGGGPEWTSTGVLVCDAANNQQNPVVTTDGNGGAIVAWEDYRNNSIIPDVYASRLTFDGVLPVELTSFKASTGPSTVSLIWATSTEKDNYGFEVERQTPTHPSPFQGEGDGGQQWSRVGFVEGAGTSTSPREYTFTDRNLSPGKYSYRLKQIDRNGEFTYSKSVRADILVPRELTLQQNYPNPFNPSTTIEFTIPEDGKASLKVYDAAGREVATLVDEEMKAGVTQKAVFDASQFSSGVYFSKLSFNGKQAISKMLVAK